MSERLASSPGRVLLYVPWQFDMLGGVDVVVDRLWHAMEARSPGTTCIGIQDCHYQGERSDGEGRRFLHLNMPPPATDAYGVRYVVTLARRLPPLLGRLRRQRFETVNVHFPTTHALGLALLKRHRLWKGRIVLSFHGSDVDAVDANSATWQRIAEQADAVTACSKALAQRIEALRLFKVPVQVIHNGIDGSSFLAGTRSGTLPCRSPFIVNVGNFVPNKGQDILLAGFARIAAAYPELQLVCVGGTDNGRWLERLRTIAAELQIAQRVIFLENQPQAAVASLMEQACCLVHAAHRESFGLVLIEAGIAGTPLVAAQVGGIPEIVPSEEFGLLFEDGNVAALAKRMRETLDFPERAAARSLRLQERVRQHFSAESMLSGYLYAYSRLPPLAPA